MTSGGTHDIPSPSPQVAARGTLVRLKPDTTSCGRGTAVATDTTDAHDLPYPGAADGGGAGDHRFPAAAQAVPPPSETDALEAAIAAAAVEQSVVGPPVTLTFANRPILQLRSPLLGRPPEERVNAARVTLDRLAESGVTGPVRPVRSARSCCSKSRASASSQSCRPTSTPWPVRHLRAWGGRRTTAGGRSERGQ